MDAKDKTIDRCLYVVFNHLDGSHSELAAYLHNYIQADKTNLQKSIAPIFRYIDVLCDIGQEEKGVAIVRCIRKLNELIAEEQENSVS